MSAYLCPVPCALLSHRFMKLRMCFWLGFRLG
uniref:Uncharacterized protein n=1 Tax=Anguilla anguilla TaxID=7936 RepID=A0A0E9QEJ9_ANGAN